MSDLIYNFAQSSHPGRLTQLGQMGAQVYNQFQAKKAEQERTAQYNSLLRQFNDTQDLSLIPQLQNIAPEKFEGMQKAWSMMDQIGKERQAQTFGEVLRMVKTGSTDIAQARLEELAGVHEANGEQASADQYRKMIQQLESGDSNSVASYLTMALGQDAVGRGVLDAMLSIDQGDREQSSHEMQIFEKASELTWPSEETKQEALLFADQYGEDAQAVVELSSVLSTLDASGMTSKDVIDAYLPLKKDYDDEAASFESIISNAQVINDSAFLNTGAADQQMVALFNKVLDPDSVVRQSEVDATLDAAGMINTVTTAMDRLRKGERLGPEASARLVEAVNLVANNAKGNLLEVQDKTGRLIDAASLDRRVIFDSLGTPAEVKRDRARLLIGSVARESGWPADEVEFIKNASLADLKREFPNTYARIEGNIAPIRHTEEPDEDTSWINNAEEL